jgi:hypothetical protein
LIQLSHEEENIQYLNNKNNGKKMTIDSNSTQKIEMESADESDDLENEVFTEIFRDKTVNYFICIPIVVYFIIFSFIGSLTIGQKIGLFPFICVIAYVLHQIYLEYYEVVPERIMQQMPDHIRINCVSKLDGKCKIKRRKLYGRL